MTLLDTPPVVVTPASPSPVDDSGVQPPTVAAIPTPEPSRRPRRWVLAASSIAALLAAGIAVGVSSPWGGTTPSLGSERIAPPGYVRLVAVTPSSIALRWSAPLTDSSVVGYEIIRNGVVADVVMPVQSAYEATGLARGGTYSFAVVAIFAHGLSAPVVVTATTR